MKRFFTLFFVSAMVSAVMAWDHMYIVGNATPGGWDLDKLTEMIQISDSEFEWTGWLNSGEVKFITGNDWGNTQFGADDWDKPLTRNTVFTATQLGDDKKFKLTDETKGWYTLHINTATMQISTYPRYIYPVGSGCEVDWNTDGRVAFQETEFGSGIYTGTVGLKASGELKFLCQKDWGVQFGPVVGGTGLSACGVYDVNFSDGSDDRKWNMSIEEKKYRVTVDVKNGKMYVMPEQVTFKVHATNSLKSAWENIYFYSWQNYDGYDHVSCVQLETETDGFYTVEMAAVAPVKFLLKNKTADDWTGLQSVDMNNAEAGYTEGICVEIGSSKNSDNKYLVNVLSDCQFTTYELTLGVDKETISEGETVTFTPAVGEIEGLTYTYYVNDVETSLTDNQLTLAEWGKYSVKVTTEVEGNPLEVSKTITVTRNIKISAHINEAAMAILGEAKCFAWWGSGSVTQEMAKNGEVYETTFAAVEPISFLIYNGNWAGSGGEQTVDMTNTVEGVDKGYDANRLVHVVEVKNNDNKLVCYHIDAVNTNKVTVNLYAEDAEWASAYFFTQHVAVETGYNNVFVHPTKDADNWYSYTYEGVNAVDWVARPNSDKWDNQVNDVAGLSGEKYLYVLADKHDNGHHKMADMVGKTLPQTLTYAFKFDGTAHTSWGNANPVVLRSWQYYSEDCAEAADHVKYITMEKDADGVYSATLKAFNNVKMCLQSTAYGYHEDGSHWTVQTENKEEEVGFTESKKFWIKDNGAAHYLVVTENFDFTPAEMTVTLNKDGFASFFWDKNYALSGAEAYVAHISGDAVVLSRIDGNGIIPANSAVILYGEAGGEATATETLDAAEDYDYSNALRGTTSATTPAGNYYVLAEYQEQTCFVKISNYEVPANRAYLPEPAGAPARLRVVFAENTTTGIVNDNDDDNHNDNHNVKKVVREGHLYIVRDNKEYDVIGRLSK